MWRKNRAPIVSERGCVGVDLNRNFPVGHRTGMGTKKVQVFLKKSINSIIKECMITYASEEPIDQKETRAWLAFMKKANKGELKSYI